MFRTEHEIGTTFGEIASRQIFDSYELSLTFTVTPAYEPNAHRSDRGDGCCRPDVDGNGGGPEAAGRRAVR